MKPARCAAPGAEPGSGWSRASLAGGEAAHRTPDWCLMP
jgi:hypothetical protein